MKGSTFRAKALSALEPIKPKFIELESYWRKAFSHKPSLRVLAYIYLGLPCIVFFFGFIRNPYSIILTLGFCCVLYFCLRNELVAERADEVHISRRVTAIVMIIALIWTFFGGQGGFWYQSTDWGIRNAIYRDLITHSWPVIYPAKGTALSYYIGHWLVPGAIAHGIYLCAGYSVAWFWGRFLLWGWTWLGFVLVMLVLIQVLHFEDDRRQIASVFIFLLFSGMDVLGMLIQGKTDELLDVNVLHLEWWAFSQFSSITTCLFWVFNQSVAPWLATLCFLREKTPENYGYILLTSLACGPFPTVGLAVLMVVRAIVWIISEARGSGNPSKLPYILKKIFSWQNILILLVVFPAYVSYYLSNAAASKGTSNLSSTIPLDEYFLFIILEVGVYAILVFPDQRKNPIYYASIGTLLVCPLIRIGAAGDFCMRVSIPPILLFTIFCARTLLSGEAKKRNFLKVRRVALTVCLAIGMVTPCMEFYRGFYNVIVLGKTEDTSVWSIASIPKSLNFESPDFKHAPFYEYLAKD